MRMKRRIAEAALAEGLFDEDGYRVYRDGGMPYWLARGGVRQRIYAVVNFDDYDSPVHYTVPGNGRLGARAPAYVTSDGQRAYFCTRDGVELKRATEELRQPSHVWWDEMETFTEKERAKALTKNECPACGKELPARTRRHRRRLADANEQS